MPMAPNACGRATWSSMPVAVRGARRRRNNAGADRTRSLGRRQTLGGRLTVRLRPLEPRIGVRIPASQPPEKLTLPSHSKFEATFGAKISDRMVRELHAVIEELGGEPVLGRSLQTQADLQAAIREGF